MEEPPVHQTTITIVELQVKVAPLLQVSQNFRHYIQNRQNSRIRSLGMRATTITYMSITLTLNGKILRTRNAWEFARLTICRLSQTAIRRSGSFHPHPLSKTIITSRRTYKETKTRERLVLSHNSNRQRFPTKELINPLY